MNFSGGSVVKNPSTSAGYTGNLGLIPGEGNHNHPNILAWKIPWTEGPGQMKSMGLQGVGHD